MVQTGVPSAKSRPFVIACVYASWAAPGGHPRRAVTGFACTRSEVSASDYGAFLPSGLAGRRTSSLSHLVYELLPRWRFP